MTDDPELHVVGLDPWLPLPLDLDRAACTAELVDRFGGDAADPVTRAVAAQLAEAAEQVRDGAPAERAAGVQTIGLWALLPDPQVLAPSAFATFRLVRHVGEDPWTFVASLTEQHELYDTPQLETLETGSGPATSTRFRPVLEVDGEREVHEQALVFWMRPDAGIVAMLAAYSTDLVAAVEVPALLDELGRGVSGL